MEAFCIFLKQFSNLCRLFDLVSQFGWPDPELSMMSNVISDQVWNNFNDLLHYFDQPWHRPVLRQEYIQKTHEKGEPLEKLFWFY